MYTFGLAAGGQFDDQLFSAMFFLGPFGVFVIIYFGSLPLMEARQLKRRPEFYKSYMKRVPFKILPLGFAIKKETEDKLD